MITDSKTPAVHDFDKNLLPMYKIFFMMILSIACFFSVKAGVLIDYNKDPTSDSIVIKKMRSCKSGNTSIHPDATNKNLLFTASGKQQKSYQLFLFSMEGKLVKQSAVLKRQTELLTLIEKGNYLFEVFSEDVRIENGSIVIK